MSFVTQTTDQLLNKFNCWLIENNISSSVLGSAQQTGSESCFYKCNVFKTFFLKNYNRRVAGRAFALTRPIQPF